MDAAALKDSGNALFAARRYDEAIAAYSTGIVLDAGNHVLYSNRSAAFLARGAPGDILNALSDANHCIRLQPDFVKAHCRRASALIALKQWPDAMLAAQTGLKIDAASAPLRDLLASAQAGLVTAAPAAALSAAEATTTDDDPLASFFSDVKSIEAQAAEAVESRLAASAAARARAAEDGDTDFGGVGQKRRRPLAVTDGDPSAGTDQYDDDSADDCEEGAADAVTSAAASAAVETAALRAKREALSASLASASLGTGATQIERIICKHRLWLCLNPFEVLQLPPQATPEDIRARYRKLSALVHPDKNLSNPEVARLAFEEVKTAAETLDNAEKRAQLAAMVQSAHAIAAKAWRKARRRGGDQAAAPSLEDMQARETRKAFAEREQRRLTYEARVKAEAKREVEAEADEEAAAAAARVAEAAWAAGSEHRMGSWHSFAASGGSATTGATVLNDVARFGAGRFADVLQTGATGAVTRGGASRGPDGTGAAAGAADTDAPSADVRPSSKGAAAVKNNFSTDEYKKRWR